MKKLIVLLVFLLLSGSWPLAAQGAALTPEGLFLKSYYDSLNVEQLWGKGLKVDWESGEALRQSRNRHTTHCSAFVAAILKRNSLYILRPPEHKLKNLANAQWEYLQGEQAQRDGWKRILGNYEDIQDLANQGYFVIAVLKSHNPEKPGHIAFVYPYLHESVCLGQTGPYLIQAGFINAKGIPLLKGFERHTESLDTLQFYYNFQKINILPK